MATFDVNDRKTWNWVDGGTVTCTGPWDVEEYGLSPVDKGSFYQCSNGEPYFQLCPPNMVYSPVLGVPDFADIMTEQMIYDWAIQNGIVSPDQRSQPSDYPPHPLPCQLRRSRRSSSCPRGGWPGRSVTRSGSTYTSNMGTPAAPCSRRRCCARVMAVRVRTEASHGTTKAHRRNPTLHHVRSLVPGVVAG